MQKCQLNFKLTMRIYYCNCFNFIFRRNFILHSKITWFSWS